jgi:tRNA threonylcarbamoyladenosine biosynthesis protein TsaB
VILALDTATEQVGVALGDARALRGEVRVAGGRRHAERLAPAIRSLCEWAGVRLDRLAAIAVGIGPGLFTGLRVGVTTAKVMAQALRVPVIGVPSLDLVAYPLRHTSRHPSRVIAAVLDARRHEIFYALYRPLPGGVQRIGGYEVGSPADLVAELSSMSDDVLLAGDGVARYADDFASLDRAEVAGPEFESPSVTALVALAAARVEREEFDVAWDLTPMYLRASDAELAWEPTG